MWGCGKPAVGCESMEELRLHGASCDVIDDLCSIGCVFIETSALVCFAGRDGTGVRGALQEVSLAVAGGASVFGGGGVQVLALQRSVAVRRRLCCVGGVALVVRGANIPRPKAEARTVWASKTHFL